MKLFYKTMLLFAAIIVLQSFLTILFLTRTISRNQTVDAMRELTTEASSVYDNFNSWKSALWKKINQLNEDENLKHLVNNGGNVVLDDRVITSIQRTVAGSGVEFTVIKKGRSAYYNILRVIETTLPLPPVEIFVYTREHPYIEIVRWKNELYFAGCVRLSDGEKNSPYIDVFIIKHIGDSLLDNLSSSQRIKVLLSTGGDFSLGTVTEDGLPGRIFAKLLDRAYAVVDRIDIRGDMYSAIYFNTGILRSGYDSETLNLAVFLSLSDYQKQLRAINRAVLTISLVSAAVTILLSLFFSGNITSPIRKMVGAMHMVKEGDYTINIGGPVNGEIGELLSGFNDMARQLLSDKVALDTHIKEIVNLKEYNEKIINAIREGIAVISDRLTVEKTNHAFLELFGLEDLQTIGAHVSDLPISIMDGVLKADIEKIVAGTKLFETILRRTPDHHAYEIKLYPLYGGSPSGQIHCILVAENISTRIEYEEKIFQAEKLSSISMLSAGMAHEINNPLSSILTNTQNLLETETNGETASTLKLIEQETKRIAGIVRDLLDFSSPGGENYCPAVNETIGEVTRLAGYSVLKGNRIAIRSDFDPACPGAAISKDELKQVIINLIKNSLQAMEKGGTVTVKTVYFKKRGQIGVSVSDDGAGIPPELFPRIFDPFFTTKSSLDGTGLGLSVVYGIVTKYKGSIHAQSRPGYGTTVSFEIPARTV